MNEIRRPRPGTAVRMTVNGIAHDVGVAPETTLLTLLRNDLGLTGTRFGCGYGACGACAVLIDDEAALACKVSAVEASGKNVTTIEGLARNGELHPVQRAFVEEDAMQCGYCTSGMIIAAVALLRRNPRPDDGEIRAALAPHLCRCGVYLRAIRAVRNVR